MGSQMEKVTGAREPRIMETLNNISRCLNERCFNDADSTFELMESEGDTRRAT